MGVAESVLGSLVTANNARIRGTDPVRDNPRPPASDPWRAGLVAAWPDVRDEWDAFVATGNRLPLLDDVLTEDQGTIGVWRAGLLVADRRPCAPLSELFPRTMSALGRVTGLRSALWSVLEPGAELPEHTGPNAGVLRYHLGVRCGTGAALTVGEVEVPYRDGEDVLFDDTAPHAAWNHGPEDRVTLFLEVDRPLHGTARAMNRVVQKILSTDPRYRRAPARAAAWDAALNPRRPAAAG